ncbi:MAG: glycosyltransferase, partial [Candidatus Eisenbacteria bacterium]|nr:glycosyltransferase [Candidatus Eisenbacteria bacterium]
LLFSALAYAGALALLVGHQLPRWNPRRWVWASTLAILGAAGLATWFLTRQIAVLPLFGLSLLIAALGAHRLTHFTAEGRFFLTTYVAMVVALLGWGLWFLLTIPVSPLTRALLLAGYPLLAVTFPSGLLQSITDWEVLCRSAWRRPGRAIGGGSSKPGAQSCKVSLHVPAYAEPPELVMATLDALAALEYPNFEVLVIDNNTKDPALWRPVEAHCLRLGPRFRFFHLDDWPGAKAGALNFALTQSAHDAEVIGVIDADYLADRDFLARLIGYFDDPRMGFVQTPHDYREWEDSLYLRMCYWEYRYFFASTMVALNEHHSALTVGTMCLIRRRALEDAGGWAEWCVTEDSELAIRIHACGYTSVYLPITFGRGLIPQTFGGYKRQRFRWTYGPIQELKRHLRLFLPRRWKATASSLLPIQKILHLNHGLDRLNIGLQFMVLPLYAAAVCSMVWHREVIPVPGVLWLSSTVILFGGWVMWWLPYRALLRASMRDVLGAFVASKALSHTVTMSAVKSLYTRRIPWQRTNKFPALPLGLGTLATARVELMLGLALLLGGAGALLLLPHPGLLLLFVIGGVYQSLSYLAAPALAMLAEREVALEGSRPKARPSAPVLQPVPERTRA